MTPFECPKASAGEGCGQLHTGCIGHNRAGGPCGAQPMLGTGERPRCRHHLGTSPALVQAQFLAERQASLMFSQATEAARREGLDLIDPLQALHELADEVWRWKEVCKQLVGELKEIRYRSGKAGEQVRAEIVLYERSMERAGKLLAEITRLGIEERMMRVTNAQVQEMVTAIDHTLLELGIDSNKREVAGALARHLRAASSGNADRGRDG